MHICIFYRVTIVMIASAALSIPASAQANPPDWIVTQLTNNNYDDGGPQVCGSNIVWQGKVDNQYEIFLYDSVRTIQLTNNNYNDRCPQISGSNVVWEGLMHTPGSDEIFMYDGAKITQITSDSYTDIQPKISGSNIVWNSVRDGNWEIFLYDGKTTIRLTNNDYADWRPRVSCSTVVWQCYDGNDWEIFIYDIDTATTTQITDNSYWDQNPQISGSNIVWEGYDVNDNVVELFLYDGTKVIQLTDNDTINGGAQISGTNVVWQSTDIYDHAVFFYNGITTTQLTDYSRDVYEFLAVSDLYVVWSRLGSGDESEIFLYDGNNTIQLTDNSYNDVVPQISGSTVVWTGYDGGDGDIFMASPLHEPLIEAEIDINPDTLNLASKGKWITCHIWLPEEYDVADIDSNSVLLEDETEPQWLWFVEDQQVAMARFSRSDVREMLVQLNQLGETELTVSGKLADGTKFAGSDVIRVINKTATKKP